jgi:prepilin-type N-terminal cleavage/methylation domain-containing protein
MKRFTRVLTKRLRAGFSLPELLIALSLVTGAALPILAVLAHGLSEAQQTVSMRSLNGLRTSLRQMLSDSQWPQRSVTPGGNSWEHKCWFDSQGQLSNNSSLASTEVRLSAAPGLGFSSSHIEAVRVEFYAANSERLLQRCVIQRKL